MLIYLELLVFLFAVMAVSRVLFKNPKSQKIFCLILSAIAVYLVLALKAPCVGRDIEGYKQMYKTFKSASWSDYDLYWTESGYEFLEMFFTHTLKFSFQGFAATIYGFSILSYSIFFYRYSEDVTLSWLVYICFGFFTFDTSGIRNMLSIAIVLLAVFFAEKKSIWLNLIYFALIVLAAQIHRGSYFCILMFFFIRFSMEKSKKILLPLFAVGAMAFRPFANTVLSFIDTQNKVEEISIGGNIIAYIFILVFPFVIWYAGEHEGKARQKYIGKDTPFVKSSDYFKTVEMPLRVFYFGVIAVVMAGASSTLVRVAQSALFFSTLVVPNSMQKLEPKSRLIMKTVICFIFALYFYLFKLRMNELDMCPYIFYWNY